MASEATEVSGARAGDCLSGVKLPGGSASEEEDERAGRKRVGREPGRLRDRWGLSRDRGISEGREDKGSRGKGGKGGEERM